MGEKYTRQTKDAFRECLYYDEWGTTCPGARKHPGPGDLIASEPAQLENISSLAQAGMLAETNLEKDHDHEQ